MQYEMAARKSICEMIPSVNLHNSAELFDVTGLADTRSYHAARIRALDQRVMSISLFAEG
jgi:hypothetical protein